jgi:hypothetical protein
MLNAYSRLDFVPDGQAMGWGAAIDAFCAAGGSAAHAGPATASAVAMTMTINPCIALDI